MFRAIHSLFPPLLQTFVCILFRHGLNLKKKRRTRGRIGRDYEWKRGRKGLERVERAKNVTFSMEESAGKRARGCKKQFGTNSRLDPWLVKCGNIGGRLLSPVHTWNSIVNPILRNSIETAARSNSIGVAWLSIKKEREREREKSSRWKGKWSAVVLIDCLSSSSYDDLFSLTVFLCCYVLRLFC